VALGVARVLIQVLVRLQPTVGAGVSSMAMDFLVVLAVVLMELLDLPEVLVT
jgi:hypothetical protein